MSWQGKSCGSQQDRDVGWVDGHSVQARVLASRRISRSSSGEAGTDQNQFPGSRYERVKTQVKYRPVTRINYEFIDTLSEPASSHPLGSVDPVQERRPVSWLTLWTRYTQSLSLCLAYPNPTYATIFDLLSTRYANIDKTHTEDPTTVPYCSYC